MEEMDVLEAVYDCGKNRAMARHFQPDLEAEMKQWKEESVGVDELLAHAGYNVRASDLTHVAQRIEELDSILGAAPDLLASDTVHYNPSDLVSWIEGMLDEVGPVSMPPQPNQSSSSEMESVVTTVTPLELGGMPFQGYAPFNASALYEVDDMDLGKSDVAEMVNPSHPLQQQRPSSSSSSSSCLVPRRHSAVMPGTADGMPVTPCGISGAPGGTVFMPTIHENDELTGVRLVHLLLACANAVQRGDLAAAIDMLPQLRLLVSHPSAMARVATQFVEALSRRIQNAHIADAFQHQSQQHQSQQHHQSQHHQSQQQHQQQPIQPAMMIKDEGGDSAMDEILHFHFYETCPYLKFAHFTANQAILEALEGHKSVHVVDLNLQYGLQWPALIQALALRPGGPPTLHLTGIGPPQPRRNDLLQEIGLKLAQLAETVNVDFTFHGVVAARLDDVQPYMFTVRRGEAVAVNSVFQMHKVLGEPGEGGGAAGGTARRAAIDEVLRLVRNLKPKIVTLVEQDADHNGPVFMERFMAALHYYSTMFDSLEACNLAPGSVEQMVAETYLGREISNIVAYEGAARTERHETLSQWRLRMARAGFQPLYLGSNAFKQANMLLTLFSGDGYRVEEKDGCLTLGWHSRPLVAASAWECV